MKAEEFKQKRELLKLEEDILNTKHKLKMQELEFERESNERFFKNQMNFHRLKRRDTDRELTRKEALFNNKR